MESFIILETCSSSPSNSFLFLLNPLSFYFLEVFSKFTSTLCSLSDDVQAQRSEFVCFVDRFSVDVNICRICA